NNESRSALIICFVSSACGTTGCDFAGPCAAPPYTACVTGRLIWGGNVAGACGGVKALATAWADGVADALCGTIMAGGVNAFTSPSFAGRMPAWVCGGATECRCGIDRTGVGTWIGVCASYAPAAMTDWTPSGCPGV